MRINRFHSESQRFLAKSMDSFENRKNSFIVKFLEKSTGCLVKPTGFLVKSMNFLMKPIAFLIKCTNFLVKSITSLITHTHSPNPAHLLVHDAATCVSRFHTVAILAQGTTHGPMRSRRPFLVCGVSILSEANLFGGGDTSAAS